jgi:hypothetical protein
VDFYVYAFGQCTITNIQSQNSGQFFYSPGTSNVQVSVRDVQFSSEHVKSTGRWIETSGQATGLLFENITCTTHGAGGSGGTGITFIYFNGAGVTESATFINVSQAGAPGTTFVNSYGGAIRVINYMQYTSTSVSTISAIYPEFLLSGAGTGGVTPQPAIYAGGGLAVGNAALATSATRGFLYIPTCAGAPTGTPTAQAGTVPIVFDTADNKLYFYAGGAWEGISG